MLKRKLLTKDEVLFSESTLESILDSLKEDGYRFQRDWVICNVEDYMNSYTISCFKSIGVNLSYLNYPINSINLVFWKTGKTCEISVLIEGDTTIITIEKYSSGSSPTLTYGNEKYSLFIGDEVPSYGLEGELLVSFRLCAEEAFLNVILKEKGLCMSNDILYTIFGSITFSDKARYSSSSMLLGISKEYSSNILSMVQSNCYLFSGARRYYTDDVVLFYKSRDGLSYVYYTEGNGLISVWYTDVFTLGNKQFELAMGYKESSSFVDMIAEPNSEFGLLGSLKNSFKSEFAFCFVNKWQYKIRMLNNDVNDAIFNLSDISMKEVMAELKANNYSLSSLGLYDIKSFVSSASVCGFYNNSSYVYLAFYYNNLSESLLLEVLSSIDKLEDTIIDGRCVKMFDVVDSKEYISTFVSGFNFPEFKAIGLVG